MSTQEVWFSHAEKKWEVNSGKFSWTDKREIWDFDACTIGLARDLENRLLVVVRSKTNKNSEYMGNKPVELRYMLGFVVNSVSLPRKETYTARKNLSDPKKMEGPKERWVFSLKGVEEDDDYCIWEWAKDGGNINSSIIYRLYKEISDEISSPSKKSSNIFNAELQERGERIIPVIYQPAIDSLGNFIREVHCAKKPANTDGSYEVEVSIIFNNEELRKHAVGGILTRIYQEFRRLRFGRILDVETFKILIRKSSTDNTFIFESIYSGEHQLEDDSIHGDSPPPPAPERKIKYYFINNNHPVVFINTSNHAMSEHNTNHRLWMWEYVAWLDNAPIRYGEKTREEIEKNFKPVLKFW